jgi:predicted GNAT family N-acyltransferase
MMNRMDKVKLRVNVHIIDREVVLDFLDNPDGVKEEWHIVCHTAN